MILKILAIASFLFTFFVTKNIYATDEWRVIGLFYEQKSKYDPPPNQKWHKTTIKYNISSAPSGLSYLIDNSFDTWDVSNNLTFQSGTGDITISTASGEHTWFGRSSNTRNSITGEITSSLIELNTGTVGGRSVIWTDGNEDADNPSGPYYIDVQNTTTHEIGHSLGIHHHSTGNGEPTMATRAQVPSFNNTLKRRTLESDDWLALDFLYTILHTSSEYPTIYDALNSLPSLGGTVVVDDGSHNVFGNLTISSGVKLELQPNATLNFSGSYKLNVYGTLNCLGQSGQPVTINGQNYSRGGFSNAMVDIKSGATAIIQYTNFINSPYHVITRNNANTQISHCNFSGFGFDSNSRAITVYQCSTGTVNINHCTFTGSGQNGIGIQANDTFGNSNVIFTNNAFSSCRYGIRCYSSYTI